MESQNCDFSASPVIQTTRKSTKLKKMPSSVDWIEGSDVEENVSEKIREISKTNVKVKSDEKDKFYANLSRKYKDWYDSDDSSSTYCEEIDAEMSDSKKKTAVEAFKKRSVAEAKNGAKSSSEERKGKKRRIASDEDDNREKEEEKNMKIVREILDTSCLESISACMCKLLEEVDCFRGKSKNLHGGVSGKMKKRIAFLKDGLMKITTLGLRDSEERNTESAKKVPYLHEYMKNMEEKIEKLQKFKDESVKRYQNEIKKRDKELLDIKKEYSKLKIQFEKHRENLVTSAPSVSASVNEAGGAVSAVSGGRASSDFRAKTNRPVIRVIEKVNFANKNDLQANNNVVNNCVCNTTGLGKLSYSQAVKKDAINDGWIEITRKKRAGKIIVKDVNNNKNIDNKNKKKLPRTEAITIFSVANKVPYAEILSKAQQNISLQELGIDSPKIRKSKTGGLIIQIKGNQREEKAELLRSKLCEMFDKESEVKISRPMRRGDLKIFGLNDAINEEDICKALASAGECKVQDVKVSKIRRNQFRLNDTWASCPLSAAIKISNEGRIKIGWFTVRVELQPKRPDRCYKCLASGHTKDRCPATVDRSSRCFKCCDNGHKAVDCKSMPFCIMCSAENREYNHRIGSVRCVIVAPAKREYNKSVNLSCDVDNFNDSFIGVQDVPERRSEDMLIE